MYRPKIKIESNGWDHAIEALGGIMVLMMIIWPAFHYHELPESMPRHFNALGKVDGFSAKEIIWLLPAIGTILYVGLMFLSRYPHLFNYPTEITEQNAEGQYRAAIQLIRSLNIVIAAGFFYIEFATIQTALNKQNGLEVWFLPVFIGGISSTIGIYLYHSFRQ